jgi:outer membrane protein assembly factor BamB
MSRLIAFLVLVGIAAVGGFIWWNQSSLDDPPEPIEVGQADWPWWRGPTRDGVSGSEQPPHRWGEEENVLWKVPVPGRGHSSPTVVGDRVFLTTADEQRQAQSVLCYDRETGRELWKTDVHQGGFESKGNARNSHASSTVACDGRRIFVTFNHKQTIHATALDLDGKQLWQTEITDFVMHQGFGSSPAVYESLVYVAADHKGGGVITAMNRKTGKVVWKHSRPSTPNYASPIILNVGGRDQLFLIGCDLVSSFDPVSGKKLWEVQGSTTECVTSTVTDGKCIYSSGGYPRNHIDAVLADGSGKVHWSKKERVYVPSMQVYEGHLYCVTDAGMAICFNCETGQETWKARLGGTFNASLGRVGEYFFATNQDGQTFIFKADPREYQQVAKNKLGTDIYATPTICGGKIYMRVAHEGEKRQEFLYCIGEKEGKKKEGE